MDAYVLDTTVMVAALRSDGGASRQILLAALTGQFEVLISVPLMFEYEAVLNRAEHLTACGASVDDVREVLDGLVAVAKHVKLSFRWRPTLSDPNDDMVLETAVNGHARAIITFNEKDFRPAAAQFGCPVMRPHELLRILRLRSE